MKKINSLIIIVLTTGSMLFFQTCKKDDFGVVGTPFNKAEYFQGTWKCTNVTQIDEYAIEKELSSTELDITDYYNFTDITAVFNVDENLQSTTFSIDPAGTPNFIITSGTWEFDNYNFPTLVYLYNVGSSEISCILEIGEMPRPETSNRIIYKWVRKSGGKAICSYQYTFEKQP